MTYYRKKRLQKGLAMSEVANYLGIDCKKYEDIDKGDIKMPKNLIDKFNELINRGRGEQQIDRINREQLVNEFWDNIINDDRFLKNKMKEFNINSYAELGRLLGYKNGCIISIYLSKKKTPRFNFKNTIYSFFENELNIQKPNRKTHDARIITNARSSNEYLELIKWFNSFDLNNWLEEHNLNGEKLHEATGISLGSISNLRTKKYKSPAYVSLAKLKKYIDSANSNDEKINETLVLTSVPTEDVPEEIQAIGKDLAREVNEDMKLKEKLITKYESEIDKITSMIEQHEITISALEKERKIFEQVLKDINEED